MSQERWTIVVLRNARTGATKAFLDRHECGDDPLEWELVDVEASTRAQFLRELAEDGEAIERMAEAAYLDRYPLDWYADRGPWDRIDEKVRETWRGNIAAALAALPPDMRDGSVPLSRPAGLDTKENGHDD